MEREREEYQLPEEVDLCYFFNPFSVEILKKVLVELLVSYSENPRKIRLFFYYPSDEYVGYLMTKNSLMFIDEIDCQDMFSGNDPREKILIFEQSYGGEFVLLLLSKCGNLY